MILVYIYIFIFLPHCTLCPRKICHQFHQFRSEKFLRLLQKIIHKRTSPDPSAVGASSQCYWEELMLLKCELMLLKRELMLLKCELMLLKFQINTNTNKNGFLLPTKCLEGVYWNTHTKFQLFKIFYWCLRIFKLSLWVLQPH